MSRSTRLLFPDVNVWLALSHQIHVHHERAVRWFGTLGPESVLAFSRQTQMGWFRLLTTRAVMGDEALTNRSCWSLYRYWIASGKAVLLAEESGIEQRFEQMSWAGESSPKLWMDAYLAAFAEAGKLPLVTFDRALAARVSGAFLLEK